MTPHSKQPGDQDTGDAAQPEATYGQRRAVCDAGQGLLKGGYYFVHVIGPLRVSWCWPGVPGRMSAQVGFTD